MPSAQHLDKSLIGMEPIQEVIETCFFTAAIANAIPLSLILVGPPGTGKSKVILQYESPHVHKTNDITSIGLTTIMEDDSKENCVRHIIIPDFNIVVSHKSSTSNLTVASLLTLMSEGIIRVDDGRRNKEIIHAPIGVITAMTRDIYEENANRFRQLGIARRFLPVYFSYSIATREKVQESIARGEVTLRQLVPRKVFLPQQEKWPITIEVPVQFSARLQNLSRDMSESLAFMPHWENSYTGSRAEGHTNKSWKIVPYRGATPIEFTPHMILRTMAIAHALRAGRKIVKEPDIDFTTRFVAMTNYANPTLL